MITLTVKSYQAPQLNMSEIIRYAKIGIPSQNTIELIENAINELTSHLTYKACYAEFPISILGDIITFPFASVTSKDLARRLYGCEKAVLIITTIGIGADRLIEKYKKISPSKAFIINSVCTERVESFTNEVEQELKLNYDKKGLSLSKRYSPGYGDLPLNFQTDIFSVLYPQRNIGVTLNDSLLMSPSKSVTAIIGIKPTK